MNTNYELLITNLEGLIKAHRNLLDIVRIERDILISSDLDQITANNQRKEQSLEELVKLDLIRMDLVNKLCKEEGLSPDKARLLELAKHFEGEKAQRLRSLHAVLDLLLKRVKANNLKNEHLIQEALQDITGAMNTVKNTLKAKPIYQKKGGAKAQATQSGQLVSRQV